MGGRKDHCKWVPGEIIVNGWQGRSLYMGGRGDHCKRVSFPWYPTFDYFSGRGVIVKGFRSVFHGVCSRLTYSGSN